jgi:hypothetical protein
MNITEADRAAARRVIRRHVTLRHVGLMASYVDLKIGAREYAYGPAGYIQWEPGMDRIYVSWCVFNAACLAAAQGRAYAKALRGAK